MHNLEINGWIFVKLGLLCRLWIREGLIKFWKDMVNVIDSGSELSFLFHGSNLLRTVHPRPHLPSAPTKYPCHLYLLAPRGKQMKWWTVVVDLADGDRSICPFHLSREILKYVQVSAMLTNQKCSVSAGPLVNEPVFFEAAFPLAPHRGEPGPR